MNLNKIYKTILVVSFVIFAFTAYSQRKVAVGAYASPALESVHEEGIVNNYYGQKMAVNYGVILDIDFNRFLSGTLGFEHSNRGGQMHFLDSANFETQDFGVSVFSAKYISVPIVVDFNFFVKNKNRFKKIKVYRASKKTVRPFVLAVSGGLTPAFAYKSSITNTLINSGKEVTTGIYQRKASMMGAIQNNPQKLFIGASVGMKATVNLNEFFGLYLRPNYSFQLNNYNSFDWSGNDGIAVSLRSFNCDAGLIITVH